MVQTKKFRYEVDFEVEAAVAKAASEAPPSPTFTAEDVEKARAEGRAEGRAAGLDEAQASIERAAGQTLNALGAKLAEFFAAYATRAARTEEFAIEFAVAVARKATPAIAETLAANCVENLIRDSLPNFMAEPRIVVRVAEAIATSVKPRLDAALTTGSYAGKVIILSEPSLIAPDCRIEWADGGVEIDTATAWRRVDEALARFLSKLPTATSV